MHGAEPTGAGSLDGTRLHGAAFEAQESLGRDAEKRYVVEAQPRAEGRGIAVAQARVQPARGLGQWRLEALRKVGLEDVAREDVLAYPLHGAQVPTMREGGAAVSYTH